MCEIYFSGLTPVVFSRAEECIICLGILNHIHCYKPKLVKHHLQSSNIYWKDCDGTDECCKGFMAGLYQIIWKRLWRTNAMRHTMLQTQQYKEQNTPKKSALKRYSTVFLNACPSKTFDFVVFLGKTRNALTIFTYLHTGFPETIDKSFRNLILSLYIW